MKINCDIGERGTDHPVDLELMRHIHIANIACGGHAGDAESVTVFNSIANIRGIEVSAHLSYPDKVHLGRGSMNMPERELFASLDSQFELLSSVDLVKFHGALYNESVRDEAVAERLCRWLKGAGVRRVITLSPSRLSEACGDRGITVLAEGFAERRYVLSEDTGRPVLMSRRELLAVITDVDEAEKQAVDLSEKGEVLAAVRSGRDGIHWQKMAAHADTICVHSDSPIALDLVRRLEARAARKDRA